MGGWTFYKIKVNGEMMSTNIQKTCHSYGMVAPCHYYGKNGCTYSGQSCTPISETGGRCTLLYTTLGKQLCSSSKYYQCKHMDSIFQAMNNYSNGRGWGVYSGTTHTGNN